MADPVGRFNIAFDDPTLTWEPTWTRLDNTDNLVTSYTIDRGRQYELDTTDTGRATVEITDTDGILDPTNPPAPTTARSSRYSRPSSNAGTRSARRGGHGSAASSKTTTTSSTRPSASTN